MSGQIRKKVRVFRNDSPLGSTLLTAPNPILAPSAALFLADGGTYTCLEAEINGKKSSIYQSFHINCLKNCLKIWTPGKLKAPRKNFGQEMKILYSNITTDSPLGSVLEI